MSENKDDKDRKDRPFEIKMSDDPKLKEAFKTASYMMGLLNVLTLKLNIPITDRDKAILDCFEEINNNAKLIQKTLKDQPASDILKEINGTLKNINVIRDHLQNYWPDDYGLRLMNQNLRVLPTQIASLQSGGLLQMMITDPLPSWGWDRLAKDKREGLVRQPETPPKAPPPVVTAGNPRRKDKEEKERGDHSPKPKGGGYRGG